MVPKGIAFSRLLLIKTLKENDLILKEIIRMIKLDFLEIPETQLSVLIPIYCQTEIILVK